MCNEAACLDFVIVLGYNWASTCSGAGAASIGVLHARQLLARDEFAFRVHSGEVVNDSGRAPWKVGGNHRWWSR
jgi:hypothetical protein